MLPDIDNSLFAVNAAASSLAASFASSPGRSGRLFAAIHDGLRPLLRLELAGLRTGEGGSSPRRFGQEAWCIPSDGFAHPLKQPRSCHNSAEADDPVPAVGAGSRATAADVADDVAYFVTEWKGGVEDVNVAGKKEEEG